MGGRENTGAQCLSSARSTHAGGRQPVAVPAAARHAAPILHHQTRVAAVQRFDDGNGIQVDGVAAVHAHKTRRVQLREEVGERGAQQVVVPVHMQSHIVGLGLQPGDIARSDQELAAQLAYQEALRALRGR